MYQIKTYLYVHMANKKTTRGKRYTPKQKADIMTFIDKYNAKQGRGGATAASKKYKISQITLSKWMNSQSDISAKKVKKKDISGVLKRLGEVHNEVAQKESELLSLKCEYLELKKSL